MLEVLKFILKCVIQFVSMLFKIDVGFTSLGVVMCICYILFPMLLFIVNFLKTSVLEELNERYDEERPRNIVSESFSERTRLGNGKVLTYNNTVSYNRKLKK